MAVSPIARRNEQQFHVSYDSNSEKVSKVTSSIRLKIRDMRKF